jgi:hypothetical protein
MIVVLELHDERVSIVSAYRKRLRIRERKVCCSSREDSFRLVDTDADRLVI